MSQLNAVQSKSDAISADVVVVGAGFAGLYLLHRLRQAGFSAVVLEAGDDVGGTWYWNRYPGARCDVESLEYSYSFSEEIQSEWEWQERFAAQPEILSYITHVAKRLDLYRDIRFNERVKSAVFDRGTARWTIASETGLTLDAQFFIMATGALSASRLPDIAGLESFAGEVFHTGRWPKEPVDFTGKRVGVVGTGSSGIQAIPVIARDAKTLTVFQRTPNYSVPARNAPLDPEHVRKWKAQYPELRRQARDTRSGVLHEYGQTPASAASPEEREAEYRRRWLKGGTNFLYAYNDVGRDPESNEAAASFVRERIAEIVQDPETARLLTPTDYPIGAKRICVDTDYFATYNRDNVSLVDVKSDPIARITPTGIELQSGARHELDMIVFATGFDAMTGAVLAVDIRTTDGVSVREEWQAGPKTYLGLAVAGVPNLFLVTGPGSPSVISNMVLSIEHHAEWITDCITHLRAQGLNLIEAERDAQEAWVAHVNEVARGTLFEKANSWYLGANIPGKPRVFMPYVAGVDVYQRRCSEIAEQGYTGFDLSRVGETVPSAG
ncbi:flavin-containing monooxygenase [Sphingomonas sp. ID0503]|uniref:flavin-containing monooxygenase n=1 Tax=Sphingomonas sp. ID0503 TaxID=3399691 RepID=UPI003AFAC5FE